MYYIFQNCGVPIIRPNTYFCTFYIIIKRTDISTTLQITGTCSIYGGNVWINEQLVFSAELPVADLLLAAYKHFETDYPKFYKMDRLAQLGFLASELLVKNRQLSDTYGADQVGIVFSNASASLDADLGYFETVKNIPSPAQFVYTLPNIVIGEISIRHRFKGENAFFVSEEFDPEWMLFFVKDLFERKKLKACICGWVELLEESYKAVLYLAELSTTGKEWNLSNINKIYKLTDGEVNG